MTFSQDTHERVQILVGSGWSERDLAALLGVARETLRKAFKKELETGRLECRADITIALYRAADGGSVAAAKAWLAMTAEAAEAEISRATGGAT